MSKTIFTELLMVRNKGPQESVLWDLQLIISSLAAISHHLENINIIFPVLDITMILLPQTSVIILRKMIPFMVVL